MSRDLTIYGVRAKGISLQTDSQLEEFFRFIERLDYEDYEDSGLIEVVSYRSKEICCAISQVVTDLFENGYGIFQGGNIKNCTGANCMVLTKPDLLCIIDWIASMSRAMGEISEKVDAKYSDIHKIPQIAYDMSKKVDFRGEEFEWFWFEYELFQEWKTKISSATFEYYYWEDPY